MLILPQLLLTVSLKETVLLLVKVITFLGQVKILLPGSWHRCLWGCPRRWGWPTCCCWWSGCCSWWRKQNKLTLPQSHCWRWRESNRGKRERDRLRTRNLAGTATAEWWLMMCIFSNIFISLSNLANLQTDRVIIPSIWDQLREICFCKNCRAFIAHDKLSSEAIAVLYELAVESGHALFKTDLCQQCICPKLGSPLPYQESAACPAHVPQKWITFPLNETSCRMYIIIVLKRRN